jgi:hypothetical protein
MHTWVNLYNSIFYSHSFFIDVYNSYELFKSSFKEGFIPNVNSFKKEKELFFAEHNNEPENINKYVEILKEKLKPSQSILEDLSKQLKEGEKWNLLEKHI